MGKIRIGKDVGPVKRLLLVVDYQRDFVDGALGFPGAEALDGPIAARIGEYRTAGDDVAFTLDTHGVRGSEGWQLYGETGKALDRGRDKVFCKPAFPSLELGGWLREQGYGAVELCGLVSHICVLSNAVVAKAALPEAEILVDESLTASYDPALHAKAMDVLEGLQVTVKRRG